MENIIRQGPNTIKAHLEHLREHNEKELLRQAKEYLKEKGIEDPLKGSADAVHHDHSGGGCPGAKMMDFSNDEKQPGDETGERSSQLRQWPVQLHLVSPEASYFQGKDVVLAADCVAYALGDFHKDYMKGKSLAIACPKLDNEQEIYTEKITAMIDNAKINTLTVMTMEVPCCAGLLQMALAAAKKASRKVPVKHIIVGIQGKVLKEEWMESK